MSQAVYLRVGLFAGTDILDAAKELTRLANFLGITVEAAFNGVLLMVRPGDDIGRLVRNYRAELDRGGFHPIATGGER